MIATFSFLNYYSYIFPDFNFYQVFNNIINTLKGKIGLIYSITTSSSTETKFYDNISSIPPHISEYIEKRFKPQLNCYEKKASDNILRLEY